MKEESEKVGLKLNIQKTKILYLGIRQACKVFLLPSDTLDVDGKDALVGEHDAVTDAAEALDDFLSAHKHGGDQVGKVFVAHGS